MRQSAPHFSALVVSNHADATLVNRVLESHGFRVERAANARAAETLCRSERFDLAVYDHAIHGAMELAGPRCPSSRPRVTVGLLPEGEVGFPKNRLHFVLRRPFTDALFAKTVKAAYGPIAVDRRVSFRHQVNIVASKCSVVYRSETRALENAQIVNISQTGMCLQTAEMLPQTARVEVSFPIPQKNIEVQLAGDVLWARASGRGGIRFGQLGSEDLTRLEDWLDSMLPASEMLTNAGQEHP
ncbi:MAG: PilZ domain-containing protein [Candidatus Angelobacter sp.]